MYKKTLFLFSLAVVFSSLNGKQVQNESSSTTEMLKSLLGPTAPEVSSSVAAKDIKIDAQQLTQYLELLDDVLYEKYLAFHKAIADKEIEQEMMQELDRLKTVKQIMMSNDPNKQQLVAGALAFHKTIVTVPQDIKKIDPVLSKAKFTQITEQSNDSDEWMMQLFPSLLDQAQAEMEFAQKGQAHLLACFSVGIGRIVTPESMSDPLIQKMLAQSPAGQKCVQESTVIQTLWELRKH